MKSQYNLVTKPRIPISVRFVVRSKTTTLQVRFWVNGEPDGGFCRLPGGETLNIAGLVWNQSMQQVEGRSPMATKINNKIVSTKGQMIAIFDRQKAIGITPTVRSVKN